MKLWAKIQANDRLVANMVLRNAEPLTRECYESFLPEICHLMDISTPVTLPTHFNQLRRFNIVVYKPRDFLEPVSFERFSIENVDYEG